MGQRSVCARYWADFVADAVAAFYGSLQSSTAGTHPVDTAGIFPVDVTPCLTPTSVQQALLVLESRAFQLVGTARTRLVEVARISG